MFTNRVLSLAAVLFGPLQKPFKRGVTTKWSGHSLRRQSDFYPKMMTHRQQEVLKRNRSLVPKTVEIIRGRTNTGKWCAAALLAHCALGLKREIETHKEGRNILRLRCDINF